MVEDGLVVFVPERTPAVLAGVEAKQHELILEVGKWDTTSQR